MQLMGVIQILPYTTMTQGVPSVYLPLGVVVIVTAIKDLYEDRKRAIADSTDNNQIVTVVDRNW